MLPAMEHPATQLLQPSDITQTGVYWYFDDFGAPAVAVEIGPEDAPRADWEVHFCGRADADSLREISGLLVGPIEPPARPRA